MSAPTFSARHDQRTVAVERAADQPAALDLFDRQRLAGDHRFVDRGAALDDDAVDRNAVARADAQPIADLHRVERDVGLGAVGGDPPRRLRREVEQGADRRAGALARPELEHLPEEHQRDDDARRLEIDRHRAAMAAELMRKEAGKQRRDDAVDIGDADADRDQRPHIGAAVDDGFSAAAEERDRRPQHDRRRQRQFDPDGRPLAQPVAQRQADHRLPWS